MEKQVEKLVITYRDGSTVTHQDATHRTRTNSYGLGREFISHEVFWSEYPLVMEAPVKAVAQLDAADLEKAKTVL